MDSKQADRSSGPVVLCALELNPEVDARAMLAADALSRRLRATLHLVHSTPPEVDVAGNELAHRDEVLARIEQELRAMDEELLVSVLHPLQGDPAVTVPALAENLGAMFLVVGTRARSGIRRLALGSTAERIVRASSVPIFVVPMDSDLSAMFPQSN
ncbi:MAG: universal stress protein [Myxococcota bacterium]